MEVEPGLVNAVVADALSGGGPGSLPLVSHALLETWNRRRGGVLTLAAYNAAGGVHGAIARTAQRVYEGLDPNGQRVARRLFLRLPSQR